MDNKYFLLIKKDLDVLYVYHLSHVIACNCAIKAQYRLQTKTEKIS